MFSDSRDGLKEKKKYLSLILFYVFHCSYILFSYFSLDIKRADLLGSLFFVFFHILFFTYWFVFKHKTFNFKHIIIAGLLYIGSPPLFENDHYRYIWEGKVIQNGHNPYVSAPNSNELNSVHYQKRHKIGYNRLTSIYPPLAQAFFVIVSPFSYKVALTLLQILCSLITFYFLYHVFSSQKEYLVLVTPFFYKEFIQSIHIDIIACGILLFCLKKNKFLLGILLSFFIKILSILSLPFLLIRSLHQDKVQKFKVLGISLLVIAVLSFYPINGNFTSGGEAFIKTWLWNSLLGSTLSFLNLQDSIIRGILFLSFATSYLFLCFIYYKKKAEWTHGHIAIAFYLLFFFSPVLHPWYLIWPLVFDSKNKFYFYFMATSFLAYLPYTVFEEDVIYQLPQLAIILIVIRNQIKEILHYKKVET